MATQGFDVNDPGFRAIVGMFASELPERAAAIEQALVVDDHNALRRIGHQLKGAAGCYGFNQLTGPATALQLACDNGQEETVVADVARRLALACREAVVIHDAAPAAT